MNNAGSSRTAAFAKGDLDEWREVIATDVESIVLVTQAALPSLLGASTTFGSHGANLRYRCVTIATRVTCSLLYP